MKSNDVFCNERFFVVQRLQRKGGGLMISFKDIRPQLKKLIQEGFETADYIMRVSKTPKDDIYAYEELGEIVRCKDCIHYDDGTCYLPDGGGDYARWTVEPDGFCAWGKRKAVD